MSVDQTQVCTKCLAVLSVENFRWKRKNLNERHTMCRPCDKIYRKDRYTKHRDKLREQQRKSVERKQNKIATFGIVEPDARRCIDCLETKNKEEFAWRRRSVGTRKARCKSCDSLWRASYYEENKNIFFERNKRQFSKLRALITEAKNKPCMDCGVSYPYYVMDLDHRDSTTKIDKVSHLVFSGSENIVKNEIAKCDVVCANCHRIRTFTKQEKTHDKH